MKTSIFSAFFVALIALSLFIAPQAQAVVILKNYTRFTPTFNNFYETRFESNRKSWEDWDKGEEPAKYTGWKSIFNLFR